MVEGDSAVLLDLQQSSDRDMTRAIIYVLGGVFVVLVLLLRALVSPVYLILTILLSYGATMGVVRLLFVDILGNAGIVWWVPMFMFVMLVALGMDYNIFLIGRVKEEVAANGTRAGTRHALARTGGIITSAGIIMAGTFASMMSGSLLGLLQIGFAVAFGVPAGHLRGADHAGPRHHRAAWAAGAGGRGAGREASRSRGRHWSRGRT